MWIHDALCRTLDSARIGRRMAEFLNDNDDPRSQEAASVFMEGVADVRGKMMKVYQVLDAVEYQADTRKQQLRCSPGVECSLCWR